MNFSEESAYVLESFNLNVGIITNSKMQKNDFETRETTFNNYTSKELILNTMLNLINAKSLPIATPPKMKQTTIKDLLFANSLSSSVLSIPNISSSSSNWITAGDIIQEVIKKYANVNTRHTLAIPLLKSLQEIQKEALHVHWNYDSQNIQNSKNITIVGVRTCGFKHDEKGKWREFQYELEHVTSQDIKTYTWCNEFIALMMGCDISGFWKKVSKMISSIFGDNGENDNDNAIEDAFFENYEIVRLKNCYCCLFLKPKTNVNIFSKDKNQDFFGML